MTEVKQFDWDAWCARRRELEERGFFFFFNDGKTCDEDDIYDKETEDM